MAYYAATAVQRYQNIIVHCRFAATATAPAPAATDRCSLSLFSPSFGCRRDCLFVARVILALLCFAAGRNLHDFGVGITVD